MFKAIKLFSLLLIMCLLLTIGSAFATWYYAIDLPEDKKEPFGLSITEFEYSPEEVVPGGSEEAPLGENHLALIEMILNESSYGLNAVKKPIIHNLLEKPGDVVYCNQTVQGGNLKHLLVDSSVETELLYFVITKISDSEYHTFTFPAYELDRSVGDEITVYKTIMIKGADAVWTAPRSYKGMAQVSAPSVVARAIDVITWYEV